MTWVVRYVVILNGVTYDCRIRGGRVELSPRSPVGEFFERRRI